MSQTQLEQFRSDIDEFTIAVEDGRVDIGLACKLATAAKRIIRPMKSESSQPAEVEVETEGSAENESDESSIESETELDADVELGEPTLIATLGLSDKVNGQLADPDNGPSLNTVEDLKSFSDEGHSISESISGIGAATEKKIIDAMDAL